MRIEDLWAEEVEPRQVRMKEKAMALDGFSATIGKVKGAKGSDLPVAVARDPLCWILHIGSRTVFPSSLAGVFESIASYEYTLDSAKSVEDIIAEVKRVEAHIKEMGVLLDRKIDDFLRAKFPDGPPK